jgi:hypothetical protein
VWSLESSHQSARAIAFHLSYEASSRKWNNSKCALQRAQQDQHSFAYAMAAPVVPGLSKGERNLYPKPARFDRFSPWDFRCDIPLPPGMSTRCM